MDNAVQRARSFEELLAVGEDGPYVFAQMFSAEGRRARSNAKRRFKLLKRIDQPLRAMLRDGERVFFVTRGVAQPSMVEWYFLGAALYYMNQRALVLTNQRILLLQIDWRQRPKEMRNEIAYTSVASLRNTWLGNARVSFHNGGSVQLAGVPKADRKWMATTFDKLLASLAAPPTQSEMDQLCPHCFAVVEAQPPSCSHCRGHFKSPRMAGMLSLVYPGAGDLYLGHNGFAYMELLGATLAWTVAIAIGLDPSIGLLEAAIVLVFMIVFMHGIDGFTTHRIAKKGLLPDSGRPQAWRFAAAAAVPIIGVGSLALMAPAKARLRPSTAVVAGDQLTDAQIAALEDAGYVEAGEAIRFFYSAGATSILQDGNLFTDLRIVSYEDTYDATSHQSAPFEEVVALRVEPSPAGEPVTWVYPVRESGEVFALIVGTEGSGDQRFIDEMTNRWRTVRSTMDGVWFEGGQGGSEGEAVIVHGVEGAGSLDATLRWWIAVWFGTEGTDWKATDQEERPNGLLAYHIQTVDQGALEIFFTAAP